MIVEDQALIGISLEAFLDESGFRVAGPFVSNTEALEWLSKETPDIALLDVMIKDGTSAAVARALKSRGVPYAVYSGLPPNTECPAELGEAPWLEKPVSRETLLALLNGMVAVGKAGTPSLLAVPAEQPVASVR